MLKLTNIGSLVKVQIGEGLADIKTKEDKTLFQYVGNGSIKTAFTGYDTLSLSDFQLNDETPTTIEQFEEMLAEVFPDAGGAAATTLYTGDGVLSGNRIVTIGANSLSFVGSEGSAINWTADTHIFNFVTQFDISGAAVSGANNGGTINILSGNGGDTSGNGGDLNITSGSATAGDGNGGAITISAGLGQGAGADGIVTIQATTGNLSQIFLGQVGHPMRFSTTGLGQYHFSDDGEDWFGILDMSRLSTSDKTYTFPNKSGALIVAETNTDIISFGAVSGGAPTADSKIRITINGTDYDVAAEAT